MFGCFAGHRRRRETEKKKSIQTPLLLGFSVAARVPTRRSGGGAWEDAPPLFLHIPEAFGCFRGCFCNFKLFDVILFLVLNFYFLYCGCKRKEKKRKEKIIIEKEMFVFVYFFLCMLLK